MGDINRDTITEAALKSFENTPDPRFKTLMMKAVEHLHAFVRETALTPDEWLKGIEFLRECGKISVFPREEFILLSDTLGVSMLMDLINDTKPPAATDSSVLGPFYRDDAPELAPGSSICKGPGGEIVLVSGQVTNAEGTPIEGAKLDVWQNRPDGLYDLQDLDRPEEIDMRGVFFSDRDGHYEFETRLPISYSIPTDGPVGDLLNAAKRSTMRPAHIHFMVSAESCQTLTTELFVEGDKYLEIDAVFGVKHSLISDFPLHTAAEEITARNASGPFRALDYDFNLARL